MITEFINRMLNRARYKLLGDGMYFGEIPGLRGVWASQATLEECRRELKEVLEDWLVLKLRGRETIPGFRAPNRSSKRKVPVAVH